MRREAALILGAVGSVLVLVLQIALGQADVSALAPAVDTVLATAAPLLVAGLTRAAVWSRSSVDTLVGSAPALVQQLVDTYGRDMAVDVLRSALADAERRLKKE